MLTFTAFGENVPIDGSQILSDLGGDNLNNLPDYAEEFMEDNNISPENAVDAVKISPKQIIDYLIEQFKSQMTKYPSMLG